jgi:hypothetical protein
MTNPFQYSGWCVFQEGYYTRDSGLRFKAIILEIQDSDSIFAPVRSLSLEIINQMICTGDMIAIHACVCFKWRLRDSGLLSSDDR